MDDQRFGNFDAIRLLAAASVIFSHAFLIADGHEKNEPFVRMTGHIIGIHGVFAFLVISGFLVTKSLKTSPSLRSFAWKRFLRIYPGLAVCAIVSAFVIAPFFSDRPFIEYILSFSGLKYATKVLLLYDVYEIPSVKFYDQEAQRLAYSVNGSLWTIASEIYCYFGLFVLAALGLVGLPVAIFGLLTGVTLLMASLLVKLPVSDVTINLIYAVPPFCAGVAMYFIHAEYRLSRSIAIGCAVLFVLFAPTGYLVAVSPILIAYPIIYIGLSTSIRLGDATKFGDLSYGTYLYGWPVTQVVRSLAGESLSGWGLSAVSLVLALMCGWLSWRFVERRALAWKSAAFANGSGMADALKSLPRRTSHP